MLNVVHLSTAFFDLGNTLVKDQRLWVPGAKSAITALRQHGLRLGIISNTASLSRAEILQLLPADFPLNLFENPLVIFSSEVHHEKPDPEIFRLAVQRAGGDAGRCLFCTEDLLDTLVAQQVGMRVARLQQPQSDIGMLVAGLTASGLIPTEES